MAQDRTGRFGYRALTRVALGAVLATVIVCVQSVAARAGDDDSEEPSLTSKILRTLGLKDPRVMEYGINYSERSPLVVPPSRNLPPPVTANAAPAPNWPKDPDVAQRAVARAKKKEIHPYNFTEDARPLRPNELDQGKGPNRDDGKMASPGGSDVQAQMSPYDLAGKKNFWNFDWFKKEQYATFTGEPARTTLTDPPPGYLTPSPDQPYGIGGEGQKAQNKNVGQRMEAETGH